MAYKNQASYRAYFTKHYTENRLAAIASLGGKCVKCGKTENLEFDHIDPKSKTRSIDQCLMLVREKLVLELNKCQLLCKPCHTEKSAGELRETYCKNGHPRTSDNLWGRHCKICHRTWVNSYKRRKKARLFQLAEKADLKSAKSGFESQDGHQL